SALESSVGSSTEQGSGLAAFSGSGGVQNSTLPSLAPSGLSPASFPTGSRSSSSLHHQSRLATNNSSSTGQSNRRNEMLDLALATFVGDGENNDAAFDRELFHSQEEEGYSELALAVAWEEGPWWEN